jgi:hypothetical protein
VGKKSVGRKREAERKKKEGGLDNVYVIHRGKERLIKKRKV